MVSLLDIGEQSEEVLVRGQKLRVTGISGTGMLALLSEFPEIRKMVANRGDDVSAEALINMAPNAVAAAIAAGCGSPGDEKAKAIAASLSIGEQLDLLEAVFRMTFPGGLGPFVEKLTHLADSANVDAASGWGRVTKSPARSSNSSRQAIQPS